MASLYLDIFSGVSGDMFVGALLDLGLPLAQLESELRRLPVEGYHLHAFRASKSGIVGTKFDVHLEDHAGSVQGCANGEPGHGHTPHEHGHEHEYEHEHGHLHEHEHEHGHGHSNADHSDHAQSPNHGHPHGHPHGHGHGHGHSHGHAAEPIRESGHEPSHEHGRNYADIRRLIEASDLGDWVKTRSVAVFHRLAVAEGRIHGRPPEEVHFHEVGAVDSIVDIVGACIGLDVLGRPTVFSAPVVEGTGFVRCAHGRMPLPAPATLEIFSARGIAVTQCEEPHELVTPTGAALLAEFAESFGALAGFRPQRIGYGIGTRDHRTRPNVLRAALGEASPAPVAGSEGGHDWLTDTVAVLETNLDNLSGEILGEFMERALALGALDVFYTPAQMKKNRPGVQLTILCEASAADRFAALVLTETSALGVRRTLADRRKLRREFRQVSTPFGEITVKVGLLDQRVVQSAPEFESCRRRATAAGVPLKAVYEAALRSLPPG